MSTVHEPIQPLDNGAAAHQEELLQQQRDVEDALARLERGLGSAEDIKLIRWACGIRTGSRRFP